MSHSERSLISVLAVCFLSIAFGFVPCAQLAVGAESDTASSAKTYKLLAPTKVVQGEGFSAMVFEQARSGLHPISSSDRVTFQGAVLDHESGKVNFPPITSVGAAAASIAVLATGSSDEQKCEAPVEVIAKNVASEAPCISSTSAVAAPHSPFRVSGNKLNELSNQSFIDEEGEKFPAGPSVGSSLERIFTAVPGNLTKGPLTFTATDSSGKQVVAANAISNPRLRIAGPRIEQKGQRAQLTVQSDIAAQIFLSGGNPQITLDTNQVYAPANVPVKVGFTANEVGPYNVQALATDNADPCVLIDDHPKTQERGRDPEIAKRPEYPGEEVGKRKESERIPKTGDYPKLPPVSIPGTPQPKPSPNPIPHAPEEEPVKLGILLTRLDDNWIPSKGSVTPVLAEIYRWDPKKEDWVKPGLPRRITFSFSKCSNEKGSCLNQGSEITPDLWFEQSSKANSDMICSDDPSVTQKYFQKATTKKEVQEKVANIWCDDYGAFSRVKASAPGCRDLVRYGSKGRLRTAEHDEAQVSIPKDDNNNQIADAYINNPQRNLNDFQLNFKPEQDDETLPAGNGVQGDGLPVYEEYRGFFCAGRHTRTTWFEKDLFVRDIDNLGLGGYPKREASAMVCHIVKGTECTEGQTPVLNYNRGHATLGFDQHALYLYEGFLESGVAGRTAGYGPPGRVSGVNVDRSKFIDYMPESGVTPEEAVADPGYKVTADGRVLRRETDSYQLDMTIAHELGHGTGLPHHGLAYPIGRIVSIYPPSIPAPSEGTNLQYYAENLCTFPLPEMFWLGNKMSPESGDETCFMCYRLYNNLSIWINGNGFDCRNETDNSNCFYERFCSDKRGKFYNFGERCAGSAVFGNCKSYLIVNDNPHFKSKWIDSNVIHGIQEEAEANAKKR